MDPKIFMRAYCMVGLGDTKGLKEDLQFIAETESNFVCGEGLIIATFMSTLRVIEIEEFLKMNERSFIVFEMTPGFFGASIENPKFQEALFGGIINSTPKGLGQVEEGLIKFMKTIKEDLGEIEGELSHIKKKEEEIPTLDEILDKINDIGVENLTEKEKQLLEKYSN